MPRASRPPTAPGALAFVDATGGAFAALAAAFARAHGREATAASTAAVSVPAEIATVLGEVGLERPDVAAAGKSATGRIDVSDWGHPLHKGEGELEKLAVARIARDRIERRVDQLFASPK
jgi:hypothetical protein